MPGHVPLNANAPGRLFHNHFSVTIPTLRYGYPLVDATFNRHAWHVDTPELLFNDRTAIAISSFIYMVDNQQTIWCLPLGYISNSFWHWKFNRETLGKILIGVNMKRSLVVSTLWLLLLWNKYHLAHVMTFIMRCISNSFRNWKFNNENLGRNITRCEHEALTNPMIEFMTGNYKWFVAVG